MNPTIDISHVILHTDRLTLRNWTPSDLDDLYALTSQDGVGQMCGWYPHTCKDEAQIMLDQLIDGRTSFAIIFENRAVGILGIPRYNETAFPQFSSMKGRELYFILSKDLWGRGLMPEAVKEIIRFLFEDIGLDVIFCGHFVINERSARLQEKLGFHLCGYTEYHTKMGTTEKNRVNYMTREEWSRLEPQQNNPPLTAST